MASESNCKDCGSPIKWQNRDGRWIPLDPRSDRRHTCQLDQKCESCGAPFKGANWMKVCPACYKRDSTGGRNGPPAETRPAREPERLAPGPRDQKDDVPF
jgi:uncharacterized Zn finger protein (UPF0148 family)